MQTHKGVNTQTHKDVNGQSRLASFIEALTNNLLGLFVALLGQMIILPLLNIHLAPSQHIKVAVSFALLSLLRSYLLRRLFNRISLSSGRLVARLRQFIANEEVAA